MRMCCCVGYMTNPGGRCCMDLVQNDRRVEIPTITMTQEEVLELLRRAFEQKD